MASTQGVGRSWGELDASAVNSESQSADGVSQPNAHRWWVAPCGYLCPLENERAGHACDSSKVSHRGFRFYGALIGPGFFSGMEKKTAFMS